MELRGVRALHVAGIDGGRRDEGTSRASILTWLVVTSALLVLRALTGGAAPAIAHDSFQYLAVAEQALEGRIGQTSLVHFDAERSFGRVPAPMVTFPVGYPLLVAILGAAGFDLTTGALVVNVVCALICVVLLWWMTGTLGLPSWARHTVLGLTVVNGTLLLFATTASTEMLFTTVVLAGCALMLRAYFSERVTLGTWAASGIAFGAAYHVRYAGIFLVLGLGVVAVRHLIRRRRELLLGHVIAGATASLLVGAGMVRNILLVGNWRGGNEKEVSNAFANVAVQTGRAINGLVLGPLTSSPDVTLVPRAVFALLVALLVVLLVARQRRTDAPSPLSPRARIFALDLLILVAVYCAFMFYAGLTTVISYGTRMFMPMIPLLALLIGAGLFRLTAPVPPSGAPLPPYRGALVTLLVGYFAFNLAALRIPGVDRASPVLDQLLTPTDTGATLRDVITRYASEGRTIVATNGQALGYQLDRPTVSLVGPHYSRTVWTEAAVRDVVSRYQAAALIVTAPNPLQPPSSDLIPSAFIESLARGESPEWLRLVSRAGPVWVYVPVLPGR